MNQVSPVAKLALKVDGNLLNQPCSVTELLSNLDSQGTRRLEALKALGALHNCLVYVKKMGNYQQKSNMITKNNTENED